jgi:hypothetical protein
VPEQSTTLRDMIQAALDDGVTYRELEARAVDPQTGKTASRSMFFDTANGKLDRMPYEHHLRAMAAALQQPYAVVRRAAIALWLPAETEESDQQLRARIDELQARAQQLQQEAAELGARIDEPERPQSA